MPRVSYTAPATVDEAVKALAGAAGQARVLSGGTDLLVQLKSGRLKPELIVDTKHIPGMIGIREEGDHFVIGAATPGVMIETHEALNRAYPGIVEGVDLILPSLATDQVRPTETRRRADGSSSSLIMM